MVYSSPQDLAIESRRAAQEQMDAKARERVAAYVKCAEVGKGGKLYDDARKHKGDELMRAECTKAGIVNEWEIQARQARLRERDAARLVENPSLTPEQYRDLLKAEGKDMLLHSTTAGAPAASSSGIPGYKTIAELQAALRRRT
jgi:hypothetical protein